jgi:hypothetical protein
MLTLTNTMKAMAVVTNLLLVATSAGAVTGQEFLTMDDNYQTISDEAAVLKSCVRQFVKEGYHNVPDWGVLANRVRKLILQKGYRDQDISDIAREAAILLGMSK